MVRLPNWADDSLSAYGTEAERRRKYRERIAELDAHFARRREEIRRACLGDASDTRVSDCAAASGIETRSATDPQGRGPKGESPTAKGGDAQTGAR
jgi:hypothetical protein